MTIRLDPGAGGRSIGEDALNMADMIVSTVDGSAVSLGIRVASGSPVSHSILYIDWGQVVEAIGSGVTMRTLGESIQEASLAVAYRHPDVDDETALKIRDFVGNQIGKSYNYAGVAQQGVYKYCLLTGKIVCAVVAGNVSIKHDSFFCSEIIWAAYASVGIKLSSTAPNWSQPGHIPKLALKKSLNYVGHLVAV